MHSVLHFFAIVPFAAIMFPFVAFSHGELKLTLVGVQFVMLCIQLCCTIILAFSN